MNIKVFIGAILVGLIFFVNFGEAYDLPKIKVVKVKKISAEKKSGIMKGSWENLENFEQQLKILSEEKILPVSAKERIYIDKNNIFIAQYKGNFYFLDKYSIKILKNEEGKHSWRQKIFPLGQNVAAVNTRATEQTFFTDDRKFYNSSKPKKDLEEVPDAEDKDFLLECFKVGYYYAFGEEFKEIEEDDKLD